MSTNLPSLTSLKAFVVVGQCLSFTQAAVRLGVTQSAVSRQIRHLENTLDIILFHRAVNGVSLTDAGAKLYDRVSASFDLIEEAVCEVRATVPRQTLKVLAPPTFAARWLSRRLVPFRQRFPDLDLSLHMRGDDNVRFDCVIRFGIEPHERQTSIRLITEQHIAVCSPELHANPDLLRRSCLLYVLDDSRRLPTWDNWLAATQRSRQDLPDTNMEFATLDMVIQAAMTGVGLAVVDRHMIEAELRAGSLIQFDPVVVTGPIGYWLDIAPERLARTRVVHFSRWMQQMAGLNREPGLS